MESYKYHSIPTLECDKLCLVCYEATDNGIRSASYVTLSIINDGDD